MTEHTDIPNVNAVSSVRRHPRSADLCNEDTHDSTVDTDGKNREAARLDGASPIGPDEITTSSATLDNAVPEDSDGFAGFDSRRGRRHEQFALAAGYELVDLGMTEPWANDQSDATARRILRQLTTTMNRKRPTRMIEFSPIRL